MKQKNKFKVINKYTTSALVVLFVATAGAVVFLLHNTTNAAPPTFSFTGVANWRQGPTNQASMVLFHKSHDCFTSVSYKTGSVDADNEVQKTSTSLARDGYTVTSMGSKTLSLQTTNGKQSYKLRQLSVTGQGSAGKLKAAQEFGYIQLSNGYVTIEGYCDSTDQLPATIPALQAIKFNQ